MELDKIGILEYAPEALFQLLTVEAPTLQPKPLPAFEALHGQYMGNRYIEVFPHLEAVRCDSEPGLWLSGFAAVLGPMAWGLGPCFFIFYALADPLAWFLLSYKNKETPSCTIDSW